MTAPEKDKGYLLPEVIDPQRIRLCIEVPNDLNHIIAFWDTIARLSRWFNWAHDDDHTARLAAGVWRDVYNKARQSWLDGECASEETCQTYPMTSPRFTWFPENPYNPSPDVPDGYLFHPWTVADNSTLGSIISLWGLGYQVGDVYTDLTKLPPGDWGEIIDDGYLFFPRFRINDLKGSGTVKIHFLNIPQGGRALIVVDGVLDLLNLQLIELNKDGVSIPPETQVPLVIEIPITVVGEHFIDVVFVPNVNDEAIPFFFGGGVRQIEICGFGLEGCGDVAGCCPDDNRYLKRIYQQNNQWMSYVFNIMDDGESANSFEPDAPENYDSNTGDENPNARTRALCAAVARYVWNVLGAMVEAQAASDLVTDILELFPPFGIVFGLVDTAVDIAQDAIAGLVGDEDAVNDVICHMLANLTGQAVTQSAFRDSVNPSAFTPLSNQNQIAIIVDIANASKENWRAFTGMLPDLYETIAAGGAVDCPCDCEDDIELTDFMGTGTIITPLGDCVYKFYQASPIFESGSDRYYHSFRDSLGRCLRIEHSDNPSYGTAGTSDFQNVTCDGTAGSGIGGFSPSDARSIYWRQSTDTNYFKITLAED